MAYKTQKQLAEELAIATFKAPFQFARDLAKTAGKEMGIPPASSSKRSCQCDCRKQR